MIAFIVYAAIALWIWWVVAGARSYERDHMAGTRHYDGRCRWCDSRNPERY